ncbi:MAG: Uma2 family endonuclease [Bryobacteraceae bacterium]
MDRCQPDIAVFSSDLWREWDQGNYQCPRPPKSPWKSFRPVESAYHLDHKLRSYLKHGVKEVWLVYTEEPHIYVHTTESIQRLEQNDTLTTPQLPGWSLVVGDAFSL